MARTAKSYEFKISSSQVTERVHFGGFELIRTKSGIMFKTYTGFHIWVTPYAMGLDGKAHPKSLYAWLDNLIDVKKAYDGHEGEPFDENGRTKGEILEAMVIMTQSNLMASLTSFIDEERAAKYSLEYMEWLAKMQARLEVSMAAPVREEDPKEEFEQGEKAKILDEAIDSLTEKGK